MESSDDEIDLIGRAQTTTDLASYIRPTFDEPNDAEILDADEEVLTSDPEELAEIVANRSLEKYSNVAPDPVEPARSSPELQVFRDTENDDRSRSTTYMPNNLENLATSLKQSRSQPQAFSPSSSPTHLSQKSVDEVEEDIDIDALDTSQPAPLTSSPDSMRVRYSPPQHLRRPLIAPGEAPDGGALDGQSDKSMEDSAPLSPVSAIENPIQDYIDEDVDHQNSEVSPPSLFSASTSPLPGLTTAQDPLPSSPGISQARPPSESGRADPPPTIFPAPQLGTSSDPQNRSPSPAEAILEHFHGRTLRTRTARQQHPYAIEYALYKRSMHQAGLDDAIVRLQLRERQDAMNGREKHAKPVDPEMQGFIVPENEESQDLYIPPPSPSRAQRVRSVEANRPSVDMDGLLAGFGGMISDDETPAGKSSKKNKGKEKDASSTKKPKPKPFPRIGTDPTRDIVWHSSASSPRPEGPDSSTTRPQTTSRSSSDGRTGNSANRSKTHIMESNNTGRASSSEDTSSESNSDDPEPPSAGNASDSDSVDSLERKRLRILNRMMPAAWVRRQMEKERASSGFKKRRVAPNAGQGGTKRNVGNLHRPLVLHGDSESEEDAPSPPAQPAVEEHRQSPRSTPSPRAPGPKRSRVFPPRPTPQVLSDNDNDIVDVSSSDADRRSSSAGILTQGLADDEEISTWLTRKSPTRSRGGGGGGGGGDLINRMLNRTRGSARDSKDRSHKHRTGYDQEGRKLKQAKLTSMFRASSPDEGVIEISSDDATKTQAGTKRRGAKTKGGSGRRAMNDPGSQRTFTIRGDWAELLDATIAPNLELSRGKDRKAAHNRTASTSNLHVREGPAHLSGTQYGSSTTRPAKAHLFNHKSVSTDCRILPFTAHTKFSPSTYIGRGFLQNLLDIASASNVTPVEAIPVVVFGEHLDVRLIGTEFVEQVRRLIPHWASWLLERDNETEQNVQRSFRFIALRMTQLLERPSSTADEASFEPNSTPLEFLEEDAAEVFTMVQTVSQGDPALNDASLESSHRWLSFHWFVLELAVRVACGNRRRALHISDSVQLNSANIDTAVQLLVRALLSHSVSDRIRRVYRLVDDIEDLVLETWVCLLYLIDDTDFAGATAWKPLWTRVESVLDTPDFALPYKVFESERRWEHIFAFSALNAFSCQTGRLLPSHPPISRWPWVCKTIKDIRLKEDGVIAGANARQQRIDFYVRTVTARCWLLHTMWGWSYRHPDRLLYLLHPIFQSRALAKLRDEKTDFPLFIRHLDLEHLERFSHGDTAWSIFLKIFRRSIVDDPGGARKLYSICTPIGVLNFTNENPATDTDLSRLLNRFSIFLVILITDPTQERAADCIKRIQSLISFQTADMRSREACIRAFQYTGLLIKFFKLDLAPLTAWMHNMIQSLQSDMKKSTLLPQRNRLTVLILCLIRSVAAIISTSGFDRDSTREYPETALLTADLVQVVFQLDLKNNAAARREIKLFLEAFCHAREAFMATLPPKPVPAVVVDEESQESYGFDDFELDLNDPEVLAGLDALEGDADLPVDNSNSVGAKEKRAAELINNIISPAIFEHIILGFGLDDRRLSGTPERGNDMSEEYAWVKVWVGCLKIVVENHLRTWWDYLGNWGSAKLERIARIIDVAAERRVRIQFCYLALKCTPNLTQRSSKEQKHQLILPWFQSLPHHRYTVEHKYTALICDRGLNSDPILNGLPCRTNDKGEHYVLSTELMTERIDYVNCVLTNLSRLSRANQDTSTSTDLTRGQTCIAKLFETMKHTWEHLGRQFASSADQDLIPLYLEFCQSVRRLAEELLVEASVKNLCPRLAWVPATP